MLHGSTTAIDQGQQDPNFPSQQRLWRWRNLRRMMKMERTAITWWNIYKWDGTVPRLADRNFREIALAIALESSGKITFSNKGITYEIVPYEEIGGRLDSIMADLALAVCGWDCLYKRIQALNLLGISWPSVMEYLNRDMVHQAHQRIWRLKVQKPVIALSKLDRLEVDLIDMTTWAGSNNSRRYAVSIIDCFSKYAWLLPITQKKAEKVLEVLSLFLKEHTLKVLQSDNGGEFTNAQMKELLDDLHIKHITSLPYKPSSNGQVERFNRTIKGMITQYMAASNLCRYLDVLPKIVENYNNTYHTTIKSTSAAVWASDHIGRARKNIKANVDKMLATKVKTKGVSTQVPKTGNYVQVSLVHLVGSERELDLKGFWKHTGWNYSGDIYKVEIIEPRKVSRNEFVISKAFVWVQGKRGPGNYERGSG